MNKKITLATVGNCLARAVTPLMVLVAILFGYVSLLQKPLVAQAAASNTVNFQARLMTASGAIVPDGNYNVEFKLYNTLTSSGSSQGSCTGDSACLWTETRTSTNKVRVANGYLTVELGSITSLPTSIDWSQDLYLTMNIGGTATSPTWDGEMSPRLHLTAVPHAFTADKLTNTNGSFTSTLGFTSPTANRSILLPDESGTVCLQNATTCGFALSSGSGNYIQNSTSLQAGANFNISGTGIAATALQAPLFDTATAVALGIGTTNATAINLNKSTTITGGLTQSGGALSLSPTTASITASSTLTMSGSSTSISSSSTTTVSAASNNTLTLSTSGTGQVQIASGTGGIALKANGGNTVLNVDTSAGRVTAGVNSFGTTSSTSTSQLYVPGTNNAAIAGSAAMGNTTYRVASQGRYAYVQIFNALKVVDIAVPTSPVVVGSATTTSGVSSLAVGAGYVYSLSNAGNTLQAVDVSNPSSPTVTTTVSLTSPYAATVSGRYLYVVTQDTTANFRVYDLANPGVPRLVTTLTAAGTGVPYSVAIQGKYAYLASAGTFQSINIANPAAPVSAGTLTVNSATSVAVQGKYAYLVNSGNSRLQVVNIANPASMTSVSNTIATPSDAQEIVVQNRIAYVTSGTGTSLRWYDISTPSSPVILGTYNAGSALRGISVQGRYAYIADNGASALDVVDLGGAYIQQLEAGGIQGSSIAIDGSSSLMGDTTIGGSLQVAQSMQVNGNFASSGSAVFQSTTNSATAFQIQNASGTSLFNVDTTSNGLVTVSTGVKLNVTSANATTFTTPLSSSVPTAINIPLYNPGAFGQLLAFGLPSTADTTARAISVFDARSSGTIQPAIALFSPNENDVFGLSWNGLNTTASLETASAAIALRPGGTNVKLWAGSTGVAVGSNVSSASYPLDVTGDVNTSTQYRIGGTVICTSSGCTPAAGSGNYIQNTATVQSANMYVQAATSGSVAAVLRANAAGTGDILDLKNGAGTNVATFGSAGATTLQNSTNSTAAFQVLAAAGGGGNAVLRVDTTNERVAIGVISDPIGAKLSVATGSTVALRAYQGGSSDALQLGNATADFLTVGSTGNLLLKPTTNSTTAFQIQNATGTSNLFFADTSNTRIAIAQAAATYTLDVAGDINSTTQLRVGGNIVCDSTGCIAKSGSGFYIHNQTTAQSSNMYVQAATSGSVAGVFQANASGSGDILDLRNGSGTNVATVSSTGAVTLQNSTNSSNAFQVQNAGGGQLLNVNTSNRVVTLNGGAGGSLTAWTSTSSLSATTSLGSTVVANGYIYIFGGYGSGTYTNTVQYAPIKADGTVGTWNTTTVLPGNRAYSAAVSATGYIYVIGGTTDGSTANNQSTIYIAKQNPDGTLNSWQTSPVPIQVSGVTTAVNAMSATVANNYLYILGGNPSGTATTSVIYAHINGDGSINQFQDGTALPAGRSNGSVVTANGYIYYMGGLNTSGTGVNNTYYASLSASDGSVGSWTSTTALPSTAANFATVVLNGNVYMIKNSGTVSYAPLNGNGTIGTWANDSNSFPVSYTGVEVVTYNGYIYAMGGYNGSAGTTGVYYTSGARTMIAGSLDLVGLTATGALNGDATQSYGSVGGTLTAGNTTIAGTLQVQGQTNFNNNVAVNGNSLTVGNNIDSTSTGNTLITVQSRGFAGLELYGDSTNDNTAEGGGAYVLYSTDGVLGTEAITGLVQQADIDPSGTTYTGTVANNMLVGTRSNFGVQFGTNSTVRMVLTNAGNLCIGLTSCTHKLAVNGQIYSTSSTITTGTPDLSETISAADDVSAMDVVVADPQNTERVIKATTPYNDGLVGVVSDGTSGFQIDHLHYGKDNDPNDTTYRVPLTLAGRVYVKVTNENGAIKPGDYLTSSSTPGYAMKATKAGNTIGKALGSFSDGQGKVLVLVTPGYHDPTGGLQGTATNFTDINVSGNATLKNLNVKTVRISDDASINGSLTVSGLTNVGDIVISGHLITKGNAPQIQLQGAAGQSASATLTGNDIAGVIRITIGDQAAADMLAKVIFSKQFDTVPSIVISPVGKGSALLQPYVDQVDGTSFMFGTAQAGQKGVTYTFNYQIVQ